MKRHRHYQQGPALVLCCFGSVVDQGRYQTLLTQTQARYPDMPVVLAVSSRMVLKKSEDASLKTLPEQLAVLDRAGHRQILVASCYLYPTEEHNLVQRTVAGFAQFSLSQLRTTPALLESVHDANRILAQLAERYPATDGAHNLFIHHGAPMLSNPGYSAIWYSQQLLTQLGDTNHCCSLEGASPFGLIAPQLKRELAGAKQIRLIPLLLVSGNHFVNDVAQIQGELADVAPVVVADPIASDNFCLLDLPAVGETLWQNIDKEFNKLGIEL